MNDPIFTSGKHPVSINGIEFDALIEEALDYSATVPEHPTEEGYSTSDTIITNAEALSMTLFVTDTPVTWRQRHGLGRTDDIVERLKQLYYEKKPVSVVTSKRVYRNMAIETISFKRSAEVGKAMEIPITFRQVIITKLKTSFIPDSYGKSGATGTSAGTADTFEIEEDEEDEEYASIAYKLLFGDG